jgi:hypothetical protein
VSSGLKSRAGRESARSQKPAPSKIKAKGSVLLSLLSGRSEARASYYMCIIFGIPFGSLEFFS